MRVPDVQFMYRVGPDWEERDTFELFKGRRCVVFSLPGAFTPICSSKQLPRYEELYSEFMQNGIDEVYCISVNDSFVMNAWADNLNIKNVQMIPDGCGEFTRDMDMLVWKPAQNFGFRSWRYAMVVNDMKIEQMFVEPGKNQRGLDDDPYVETTPEKVLEYFLDPIGT
jgi:peroxiredoxin